MQDKKYLIEIPDMPEGSGVWDADKWERNKDVFMEDYPNAQVFELGEYDEEDSRESDQILLSFEDEASSGIWDQAKWERNKYAFTKDNPEAQVSRVRYVDYWGQKAEDNRAEKAALQQPDEERNARLAEIGYYDDLSEGQRVFDLNAPNMIGLKPLSSAIDTNSVSGQTTYLDPRVQEFFANDSAYTDKMAEIARLDAEYDRNPNVIAQREWEAQQLAEQKAYAANLEKEIRENLDTDVDVVKASRGGVAKRGYDPLESQQMSYLLDKIAGDDAGSGEQENEKLERYTTSLKLLEKAKIARNVAGKGFGGAVIDWAKEGFMDAGTQDDIEAYNEIGNILTRLEKQVGSLKEENLTEEVFNQYLSKDEQALMKSFFEYNKAMADAQQDMSQSYKGGKIFAESIPFMLEFLATGGLYKGAGRAATRGLERALVNWVSKAARKTASRTARKIAAASARDLTYALAGTAARTLFTPGTYNRMAEESVKIEDGHLNRAKNAAVAAADMYVENLSEVSGGLIGKAFGWAGKGVGWLIGKTPLSKIGSVLADNKLMQSISAFMPKLEALGFHGLPEEIGEEFIGNAIREVMNIQPGALKEMVSDDNFGAMLIGFAPMTLIGAAGGAISLGVVNYEAAKLGNKMREMMSDHYSVEEMDAMMSSVQSASTAEEIQQAIKPMAMAIARASESGMITQEQAAEELETLYQWGGFMAQNNALLFSKKAQDNELANAKRAEMVDQYGRFWQEDETESVQVATLNNGSTVFVTSAPSEDGKITTIDVATGKKGFANVSDIATQEVEGEQIQSSTTMTMSAFLNGQIAMGRKTAEETRMTNERNAQIEALRAEVTPGTRINLGTEGSPINVFAKKVGNNGITIVDETGMESILGWEQAADALGKPIIVETDQQKLDAEISARLQRLAERRMQRKVTPAVENATTEAAEESAEITAQEQVHIPLNEDGTVNEAAFWTQDPEGYVKWNDEQNQDGGQDSLRQIAISKQELIGMLNEVAAGQNTSNPTMRKAAEKQVAAIAEKIARLEALEMSYADALAEEKETIKQTAATPTATMNEEQLEQMDAQYQGILGKTRIQGERVRVMQEYLDKLAENSAPIKVLTKDNYEEVMRAAGCPEEDIKRVGTAIRTSAITGAMIAGFASNGVTFVMADTIADINSARITYIHERQHLLNSQNPDVVKQFAAALGDKENALRILETFVGKNGLEEYKNDPIEKLADEIICRSMEIVYSTENYSVDLQNQGLSEEAINIINTIDNGQRTDKSFSSARRSSHANLSQRENAEENGRNSEQVSGGILDGEETGSIGSSGRGDGVGGQGSAGEGAEVDEESEEDAETILNEDGFEVDEQNEDVRFSVRYVPTPEQRESIIDSIIQTTGRTREKAERWLESELSLVPIVLNDKEYLDYAPDSKYKAIKDNSDYPQGTVDFNNICRKRKDFTRMYTRLQRAYPNRIFTAEDLADIRTIMSEDGLVVACGLCYVEDRRQKLGEVADEFIKDLQDGFKSYGKKNATKRANAEKFRSLVGEDTYVPSIYDLITLEGSDKLHDEHKGIWDAFGAYNRARGQQTQNTFQGYAEYKREILTWSDAKVKKVNSLGGLRIFSYSDFEAHHLLDIIQIIIDCAARGVMIQGYTKVPEFARVVEKTGIKLNRSLIPLGDTGIVDGKLAYDSVEGIDINDPNFLESNDNVGNILIGINDEQIRMAMADPFIHYIIPYHARQAGNIRAKLNVGAWSNYIDTQNERKMSDGKRVEKNINIYTDVLNESITNDKEFVEKYLEVCREKGYIPKFDQFLDKDAEGNYVYTPGYYKFLVDFKLFDEAGNILPQKAVVAEFDDEFNAQVLKDYAKEERENVGETMNSTYDKIVETLDLGEPTEDEDVRFKVSEGVIDLVEEARKADLRHRVAAEGTLVPGHKKGQPMLSDAEMMADVSFRITKNTKATIETWFNKAGVDPEMTEATINYLDFAFEDTTEQLCAAKWYLNGKISLPDEDEYKVRDAVKVAKQNKVDALSYASPMDILNTFGQPKSKVKPINPDTIKEFSNKNELAEGIVVYDVQDDFEGQAAVRKIIDTHWGEDANPWCLAARVNGDLERAKDMWLHYSKYPKRIAFRNGKLLAFYASANDKTWWDRNDEPHTNIPYSVKSKEGEYEVSTNYELKEGNKKAKKVSVGKSDKKGRTAYFVGNRLESAGIQDGERNLFYSSYSMGATLSDSTYGVGRSIEIQYGPYKNVTQITFERRTKDEPTYYVRVGYGNNGVRAVSFVEGARSWDIRYGINGDQIFVGGAQLNFDLTDELSDVYSGAYHMYRINDEEYEIARGIKKVGIVKKGEKVTMQMLEAFGEDGAPAGALLDFINDMGWNRADYPYPNPMDVDLLRRDDEVREQIRKVENEINEIAGGRYLSSVPAIRFRVTAEQDKAYMDAVEAGDMETAQRMVIEAAKLAMPNTKVVDKEGNPRVVYHQTNAKVYVNRETGQNWDNLDWREKMEWDERDDWEDYWEEQDFNTFSRINARTTNEFDGFFFAPKYDEYHEYGERTISAFVNIQNPASREDYNIDSRYSDAGRKERIRLQAAGFDGVIRMEGEEVDEYIAFEPSQIKSADPVTYDNNGNVIPLSERFNPENEDIRFRVLDTTNAELKEKPIKLNGMYRFKLKNAFKGVKDNGGSYPYIKVQLEEVPEDHSGDKITYNGILEGFAVVRIPKGLITEGEKDNVFFIDPKDIENELWDVLRATENYYEFKHGSAPYQRDWINVEEVRFRMSNENQAIFVSNAAKAVEGIKQEKATPEQWLKMIEKNGGLKAGEDKWMGLSDWLKASDKKTLTKQEVLDFIKENMIVIEEQHYSNQLAYENNSMLMDEKYPGWRDAFSFEWDDYRDAPNADILDEEEATTLYNKYNEDKVEVDEDGEIVSEQDRNKVVLWGEDIAKVFFGQEGDAVRPIHDTREVYTTKGLINRHEIALTVPTIESWGKSDMIHFGDAGDGRAIAWIRFGETSYKTVSEDSAAYNESIDALYAYWDYLREKYGNGWADVMTEAEKAEEKRIQDKYKIKRANLRKKVLVIDEIQSKRHQEGREKGYKKEEGSDIEIIDDGVVIEARYNGRSYFFSRGTSRTTIESSIGYDTSLANRDGIPDAPFDKNWHELAMKRMLRYAAENGYDVIAWTKGEQQAERYGIGKVVSSVGYRRTEDGKRVRVNMRGGESLLFDIDALGKVTEVHRDGGVVTKGMALSEIVGSDLAKQIGNYEGEVDERGDYNIKSEDFRIGGEGMKGFYDKMLPAFMNKYGKKWGVKVEDIDLPNLENGLTMHSVPVTDAMKESVMEGQVMFRMRGENESAKEFTDNIVKDFKDDYNAVAPIEIVDLNSKENVARFFNIPAKDITDDDIQFIKNDVEKKDIWAAYHPDLKKIVIFVRDSLTDSKKGELALIHENIHAINGNYPEFLALGEYLWNRVEEGTKEHKYKTAIQKFYPEHKWHDELSAYVVSEHMQNGTLDELRYILDLEHTNILNKILNTSGYGKERKSDRSSFFWNVLRKRSSGKVGRASEKKGGASELTAEERRIINEYFPGAFPEEENDTQSDNTGEYSEGEGDIRFRVADSESKREIINNTEPVDVTKGTIVATDGESVSKAALRWFEENVGKELTYNTEVGTVTINRRSVKNSLAHGYSQTKLDAITSLPEGFGRAVYLASEDDFDGKPEVNHYFVYPINYDGSIHYVLCRVKSDVNKSSLYIHEVFPIDAIKGHTLQTAADQSQPHRGISLYLDLLKEVLYGKDTDNLETTNDSAKNIAYAVNENPTEAQKEAGNYKMGHLNLDGYRITIENPKGSIRRGTDSKGNSWENTLNNDYGYIRGTEGVDGDHIDVYLSDNPSEGNVFVIDQVNPQTREFDEHKVMYGFNSAEEAREAYLANFSEGWNGLGTITEVSKDEFKKWIQSSHRKTKPFSEYKSVNAISSQSEGGKDTRLSYVPAPGEIELAATKGIATLTYFNVGFDEMRRIFEESISSEEQNIARINEKPTKTAYDMERLRRAERELMASQMRLNWWNSVNDRLINTSLVEADVKSALQDTEPRNIAEYLSQFFTMRVDRVNRTGLGKDGKPTVRKVNKKVGVMLTPETLEKELGWGSKDWSGIGYIVSAKDGRSLDAIAEMVSEDADAQPFIAGMDTMDIKNEIISFIQSVGSYTEIRDYIKNERTREAQDLAGYVNGKIQKRINNIEESTGMSIDEYNARIISEAIAEVEDSLVSLETSEIFGNFEQLTNDDYEGYIEAISRGEDGGAYEGAEDLSETGDTGGRVDSENEGEPGAGDSDSGRDDSGSVGDRPGEAGGDGVPPIGHKAKGVVPASEPLDTEGMSVDEIVREGKMKAAAENADAAESFTERINRINNALAQLRSALAAQRSYDKDTVRIITNLANDLLQGGRLSDMTRGEIKRLLSVIKDAVGKEDLSVSVDRLMDIMIANQLRFGKSRFEEFLKIKATKVNASGVEARGKLDVAGQQMMQYLKEGISSSMTDEMLSERIATEENNLDSESEVIRGNAENKLVGYYLARLYRENIKASEAEEKDLREEIKDAKVQYDAGMMDKVAYKEFIDSCYEAIRENRMQRVNAFESLNAAIAEKIAGSIIAGKMLADAEKARIERIHHFANSDMEGMPSVQQGKVKSGFWNNTVLRFLFKPLATFDQMLRSFAPKSRSGEGYLWNHFMGGWLKASENEFKGIQKAHEMLDEKVRSVFKEAKRWSDLFAIEKRMPTMDVKFWDGEKMADFKLTQGNLLYIYMVSKMTDGKMKLSKMGITDTDVRNMVAEMDPRFIELADWIQESFLPALREKYNAVHVRLFGAPMAAIDNYFPIRVLANARTREVDLAVEESSSKPSTITGSIIKRTKNSLALDILGSDAFDVVLEHIEQMEKWAAFAEFNKDLNTLLSYNKFRNRVQNTKGIYGSGTVAWNNFRAVAEIAAGVYKPAVKSDSLDKLITNIAKGVTGAKISFRVYTALKQFLSAPAFVSDASASALIRSLANPYKAWTWAMNELPLFEKRWKSRQAGDSRLMETEADWELWKNKIVELAGRYGMTPNAFVDALTVSIGARAIYETKLKEYLDYGYSPERAEEKAKRDATVLFNESQQSNESAFLSAAQVDRTVASILITVFRNSSMGYQRMYVDGIRNIGHMLKKGYREQSIEFMKKQMVRDGLEEDKAARAAERIYNRSLAKNAARVATFGFLVQFAWNLGPYIAFLLMGDDDEEKKDMITDAAVRGVVGGPVEGLAAGQVIGTILGDIATGEDIFEPTLELPATSDLENAFNQLKSDPVRAVNDMFNLLVQSGIGVNPQTITDAIVAIVDACNGDMETSKEVAFALMRILQTPQSQIDKLYKEEIGFAEDEGLDLRIHEFAERYAKYKVTRNAPLAKWLYSDEREKELEDRFIKRFLNDAEDLKRSQGSEEAKTFYEYYDVEYKKIPQTLRDLRKQAKENPHRSESLSKEANRILETDEFKLYEEVLPHIKMYEHHKKQMKEAPDGFTRAEEEIKMREEMEAVVEILRGREQK